MNPIEIKHMKSHATDFEIPKHELAYNLNLIIICLKLINFVNFLR